MNFIDEALNKHLSTDSFFIAMSDIYKYGDVRDELNNYPQFVIDIIAIIDFDTNMAMDGDIFVNDSDKAFSIIKALQNCGMNNDAEILRQLADWFAHDMDRFFSDEGIELYSKLVWNTDNDMFWSLVEKYISDSLYNYYN